MWARTAPPPWKEEGGQSAFLSVRHVFSVAETMTWRVQRRFEEGERRFDRARASPLRTPLASKFGTSSENNSADDVARLWEEHSRFVESRLALRAQSQSSRLMRRRQTTIDCQSNSLYPLGVIADESKLPVFRALTVHELRNRSLAQATIGTYKRIQIWKEEQHWILGLLFRFCGCRFCHEFDRIWREKLALLKYYEISESYRLVCAAVRVKRGFESCLITFWPRMSFENSTSK